MNDFESQFLLLTENSRMKVNEDKFIKSFHLKIDRSEKIKRLNKISIGIIILLFFLIFIDPNSSAIDVDSFKYHDTFYGLDFFSTLDDSVFINDNYFYEISIFLLEEQNSWEILDLIDEIENGGKIIWDSL